MERFSETFFLLENPVVWAILGVAFFCYGMLLDLCLQRTGRDWYVRAHYWTNTLKPLLAALPLLGLLGTIAGLLKTFLEMSQAAGLDLSELITGGIGEAMFTTQLGLLMVVPGTLLLALLNARKKRWQACHRLVEALV